MELYEAAERFSWWLGDEVVADAVGSSMDRLDVAPSGRLWLGRLAPEATVVQRGLGERGERLDPCAVGLRVRVAGSGPWSCTVTIECRAWLRQDDNSWLKSPAAVVSEAIAVGSRNEEHHLAEQMSTELSAATGTPGLAAELRVDLEPAGDGAILDLQLVNTSPADHPMLKDTNLYEARLRVKGLSARPFELAQLPDTFRYDRQVAAYGINCGVADEDNVLRTVDAPAADRRRPAYWGAAVTTPDLRFRALAADPLPSLQALVEAHGSWGGANWSEQRLDARSSVERWDPETRAAANTGAAEFAEEHRRLVEGLALLAADDVLRRSFQCMNEAMSLSAHGRYESWRPFQMGFLLANLVSLRPGADADVADIVWFATGGGKTETYLGLLVTAAFLDRLTGKLSGLTAWSRFPLRMLSLQQTQRFADALSAAEIVRRGQQIAGDPFAVGFFVGQGGSPNEVKLDPNPGDFDIDDDDAPARYRVLLHCPFCRADVDMGFSRLRWTLEHRCTKRGQGCPWPEEGLPFYVVDQEIYRYLPTVVVGTLDKAALVGMQASMRGFFAAPLGQCSEPGHGFTYAVRSKRPTGCLVPGCAGSRVPLIQEKHRFPPGYRLQDELHLLRDSLGAVDSHYEALLDDLQQEAAGWKPKILASSATLTGYREQVDALYQRTGRVFPVPGPEEGVGLWTSDTDRLARRFLALAPRGVTTEFAVDRIVTTLQKAIRRLASEPDQICAAAGVDSQLAPDLLGLYGVDVVYGNTLRDLDAVDRSLETQIPVAPLHTAQLTGRTGFESVRQTLERLEHPEDAFEDRLHVVTASSMMSHGVDIDRLNVMVMLGLPLTTAEFIQATARVGRAWPGLVFVLHKIARERDASTYRAFSKFVRHADRFVEPVPVTRHSRRVLDRTLPGLESARIQAVHEPRSSTPLTLVSRLNGYLDRNGITSTEEADALISLLGLDGSLDQAARDDVQAWVASYFERLRDPAYANGFPNDALPRGMRPMRSLRDVEETLVVRD